MRTGETVLEAIARVRGELAAAQCELMQLRGAPLPIDDLKQMATEAVSRFAMPSLQVQGGKLDIGWPKDNRSIVSACARTSPISVSRSNDSSAS